MPAFYPRPMANHLPPTPPDSGSGYGYSSMHFCPDPYALQAVAQAHREPYDYAQQNYMQSSAAPAPSSYYSTRTAYNSSSNALPPIHSYYESTAAPILPPLRIQDRTSFADGYQRCLQQEQHHAAATAAREHQQRQTQKEEKPTGGVSARLDYDMERMTDFVTQAVQCIFHHHMQSPAVFRKWVHQVLSATRLPSATILLSLHYLQDRVTNRPESVSSGENQIYRLLAVSLILGSKFLDDNTFINRSWSDVTAIKVSELNTLEMQWLQLLDYRLHVDPAASNGLSAWIESWKDYDTRQNAANHMPSRLSPIDTHVRGRDRFSPYPSPYSGTSSSRFSDASRGSRNSTFHGSAPYSPADPWAQTDRAFDDFYKRQHRYPTLTEIDDVNRRLSEERSRQSTHSYAHSSHSGYYPPSNYSSPWAQPAWHGMHRYDCACSSCSYHSNYRPYPMSSNHSTQTVMG